MPMDELLSRAMPHSPEAEQAVLGSMLIDADCVKDVMGKLQPQVDACKDHIDSLEMEWLEIQEQLGE